MNSDEYEKREKKYYEMCKRYLYFSYDPEIFVEPDDWMDVKNVITSAHKMKLNELFIEYNKTNSNNILKEWCEIEEDNKKFILFYKERSGKTRILSYEASIIYGFNNFFSVETDIDDLEEYNLIIEN